MKFSACQIFASRRQKTRGHRIWENGENAMNKKSRIFRSMLAMLLVLLIIMLAGCTENNEKTQQPENESVHNVKSVAELLEAIKPGASITIAQGKYNLTDFLVNYADSAEYNAWNENHEYVELREVYDGMEIVIKNVEGLRISGEEGDEEVEIVTEPRYSTVLNFENCTDIELTRLIMGHTNVGDCSGDVLGFVNTQEINLSFLELYGCGVYGISCTESSGNLYAADVRIHSCTDGPIFILDSVGKLQFDSCNFSESNGGGFYDGGSESELVFKDCTFGQEESNIWLFTDDAAFDNCQFAEPTMYPDYSDGY